MSTLLRLSLAPRSAGSLSILRSEDREKRRMKSFFFRDLKMILFQNFIIIAIFPFQIESSNLDEMEDSLCFVLSNIYKSLLCLSIQFFQNFEKLLFGDCVYYDF